MFDAQDINESDGHVDDGRDICKSHVCMILICTNYITLDSLKRKASAARQQQRSRVAMHRCTAMCYDKQQRCEIRWVCQGVHRSGEP